MHAAASRGTKGYTDLVAALHENRQLWTVLAANVAEEDNELPDALRAQILSLANFTFKHTSGVLSKRQSVSPLIEINAAIMRGLSGKGIEQ